MASSSQAFPLADSNSSSSSSSSSEDDPFGALIQQDQDELYEIMNSVRPEIVEQVFQIRKKKWYIHQTTTAICILAYGCVADHYDEYIKIGESTAIKCFKTFCNAIVTVYAEEYMRLPNEADIARLLEEGEHRGFSSMLGSIDCMYWEWKNCPVEWQGTHMGRSGKNTLILEAVASQDLWIWYALFGMPGSHNDIYVLDHSSVFNGIVNGQLLPVNYVVNGHHYRTGYYLSDCICPKWTTLMQTIPYPTTTKEKLFAQLQEAARKNMERTFGVLQIKWAII
ncbi:uncharacterized protein LOC132282010 [Cornus florida]|uniref:uncharacterized protein LOC132282010 n=1 Tax=Cornus florida TaxID=4283 RepID=UPI0028A039A6|nr:uncharacterized protein LOC132282010 [Cornus florida]